MLYWSNKKLLSKRWLYLDEGANPTADPGTNLWLDCWASTVVGPVPVSDVVLLHPAGRLIACC